MRGEHPESSIQNLHPFLSMKHSLMVSNFLFFTIRYPLHAVFIDEL